jgi:ribonuclease HII
MIGIDDTKEWLDGNNVIGVDEAGRGPLAGPMFIGVVSFNIEQAYAIENIGLNDSKKLAEKKRFLIEDELLKYAKCAVGIVTVDEINSGINLNQLWSECAATLVNNFLTEDSIIFVDGNVKISGVEKDIQITKPKFDSLSWAVAAASIIAKNSQVRWMLNLSKKFPEYGFDKHKGYGAKAHYEALRKYGMCNFHRKNWINL